MINSPPRTLNGKVALVTGASSGIGRAAALELARRGSRVVVGARRKDAIDELAAQIKKEGFEAIAFRVDVNVEADVQRLVERALEAFGRLDIAFNNAGTEGSFAPFLDQSNET
jgi:NAD(P)-dependent dehydrogenase (short-subunit alcohol dehydrogenase family)